MILGNIAIDTFIKGGPIMWPILITSLVTVAVIAERGIWWIRHNFKKDSERLEKVYIQLEVGNVEEASEIARKSEDPVLRVVWHGLNHKNTSLENALQVAAGIQIEKAGRFLTILDTVITLAPLLGLLGTVTGIYHAFKFLGNEELAAVKVGGGVAEALIATAAGLTIAILTLIPYNYFNSLLAKFTFEIQTAATNVEVLLSGAQYKTKEKITKNENTFASSI